MSQPVPPPKRGYGVPKDARSFPLVEGDGGGRLFSPEELCAAYLADPKRTPPAELPWAQCNMQHLLEVLRKNKAPLLHLAFPPYDGGAGGRLQGDPLFRAAYQAEVDALAGLRAEYRLVHDALAAHGIVGVLVKSVGLEPSLPFKSDNLDVLYKPGDVEQIRSTLCQMGYFELKNVEEPHKYLFRKFHAGRSVSAIHVHAHVGWMTSFLDEDKLWQRCRPAEDENWLTIPAPEDALLTTLAHWFFEDKRLTLQDVVKYAHCLRQDLDWDEIYRIATWRGWRDGLDVALLLCSYQEMTLYGQTLLPSAIREGAWRGIPGWAQKVLERRTEGGMDAKGGQVRTPLRISFVFSKAFSYAKLWRDPSRSAARRAKDLIVHTAYGTKLRLHIHSQPAMLITFSGVDGCGKTTQARALQSAFETCLLRADYTWGRGGSAGWIASLSRWHKRRTAPVSTRPSDQGGIGEPAERVLGASGKASAEAKVPPSVGAKVPPSVGAKVPPSVGAKVQARQQQVRSPWKRWVWSWLTTIELLLQYTWRVTLPLLRGRVVICDRYVEDALADWSAYFGEPTVDSGRLAARVLRALTPRPQRAYWLDVPAEVAQSRSADGLPAYFLDAQSALYGRLAGADSRNPRKGGTDAERLGVSLRRLDGSQGWEEISDRVVYDVLTAYFADYWTFINTLFWKNPGQWR